MKNHAFHSIAKIIQAIAPAITEPHAKALAKSICAKYASHHRRMKKAEQAAIHFSHNREAAIRQNRADARSLG